ncbi:hypothetical protein VNO80_27117 [Phaseolus coccineus]|uniref:Uncharacterized protein n=1 Tax=Phaseolus coccineus TaxID=3886 RepID=A0AAN9LJR0_PHACN
MISCFSEHCYPCSKCEENLIVLKSPISNLHFAPATLNLKPNPLIQNVMQPVHPLPSSCREPMESWKRGSASDFSYLVHGLLELLLLASVIGDVNLTLEINLLRHKPQPQSRGHHEAVTTPPTHAFPLPPLTIATSSGCYNYHREKSRI